MDGGLFDQIRSLFNKNTETMNQIAKLKTAQTELAMLKIENNLVVKLNNNEKE